jgi:hypothetical protein
MRLKVFRKKAWRYVLVPKAYSEAIIRRTNNARAKWKGPKGKKDLQNTTQKTNYQATRTPLKTGGELRCSWMVNSSCSTCDTHRVTGQRHEHHLIWKSYWTPVYDWLIARCLVFNATFSNISAISWRPVALFTKNSTHSRNFFA